MVVISDARDERDRLREENCKLRAAGDNLAEMIRGLDQVVNAVQNPDLMAPTLVTVWRAWGGVLDMLANWNAVRRGDK